MAFSPCFSKSLSSAQITASLSRLREPRSLPAGLPAVHDGLSLRADEMQLVAASANVPWLIGAGWATEVNERRTAQSASAQPQTGF